MNITADSTPDLMPIFICLLDFVSWSFKTNGAVQVIFTHSLRSPVGKMSRCNVYNVNTRLDWIWYTRKLDKTISMEYESNHNNGIFIKHQLLSKVGMLLPMKIFHIDMTFD